MLVVLQRRGGAKSLLLPYLSLTYLMNSMNRT
jgi:hypothetical protein